MRFSWSSFSLQSKFLVGLAAAAAAGCLFFGWAFYFHMKTLLETEVAAKGNLVLSQVEAVREYVRETLRPAMYDSLEGDRFIIEAMSTSYVSRKVMDNISTDMRDFSYRRVADNARNPDFEPRDHERELMGKFMESPSLAAWNGIRRFGGEEFYVTARPVRFEQSCMRCHGDPANAPEELIERYGGERGFGHTVGEIAGVTSVLIPIAGAMNRIQETAMGFLMLAATAGLLCFAMTNVLFNRLVVHSLRGLADVFPRYFKDTEPGMLDKLRKGDEIHEIFKAVEEMADHLSRARVELQDYAQNLERMVEVRTRDLAQAAHDHNSDVQLFVGLLSEMNRNPTKRKLLEAALPQVAGRFGLRKAAFVCTFMSSDYYIWPAGQKLELPDYALDAVVGPEPLFEEDRAFVPVQSSDASVEGLLCLYWNAGEARPERHAEVIVALARQLGIAMENLSFLDRLIRQKDLLQLLVEGISDPLLLMDGSCNVLLANQAARALTSERKHAEGKGAMCINNILGGEPVDMKSNPMDQVLTRGKACSYEIRLPSERFYHVNVYPLPKSDNARDQNFVVYARDNSAEKRMLRRIQQNEKMVTVGKLAAGVAHEMNNPLGVILCYAELLREAAQDGQQKQDVEVIIQHTKRAQNVLQDLLNFARSKKPVTEVVSDPVQVLKSMTQMFGVQAESKGIELKADIPDELPLVKAEGASLEQVFGNLLINAMDAVEPGEGIVEISARRRNGGIVVRVADNGPGISPGDVDKIFDPFFTTKEVGEGTGLGLAVVYGIVEELGGSVSVENGLGAVFDVTLPTAEQEKEPMAID